MDNTGDEKAKLFGDIFVFIKESGKSKCILTRENGDICGTYIKGVRPYNLKRHLQTVHKDFNLNNIEENCCKVQSSEDDILNAWVEIVTINGRPFELRHDSGIEKLMQIVLDSVKECTRSNIQIDVPKIKSHLHLTARKMKEQIKTEIKNKLISVSMDIATKNNRCILGINIQYMLNGRIVVRTLEMIRLDMSHTAKHLADVLKSVLGKFNIAVKQVYCITTDNARYMLLSATILDALLSAELPENNSNDNLELVEEEFYRQMLKEAEEDFFERELPTDVHSIRCGAHSMQLSIGDTLNQSVSTAQLIDKCRDIIKKLRTPTIINKFREMNLKFPLLDNITRWDGKYTMVITIIIDLK